MPPARPLRDRLLEKIDVRGADDCWPWTGHRGTRGHGYINVCGTPRPAHRVLAMMVGMHVQATDDVHHQCEHAWCCNPHHFEVLDHVAHHARHKTVGCSRHGESEMTRIRSGRNVGRRYCRACNRENGRPRGGH